MPNTPNYQRPEYEKELPKWTQADDCDEGHHAITSKGEDYLPKPNPSDVSKANDDRYAAYKDRARFTNFIQPTLTGLTGEIFAVDPVTEIPTSIELLIEDVDDTGTTLDQQARKTSRQVLKFGRSALFVDYPEVEGDTSLADIESGNIRASIIQYSAMNVINWTVEKVGNSNKLTLVVIEECFLKTDPEDPFKKKEGKQWRVLKLEGGIYMREIWRRKEESQEDGAEFEIVDGSEITPLTASRSVWTEIPFIFVGSNNNDSDIDRAPMYDLSVVNVGHYRNSADYEESCYIVGQPMLGIDIGDLSAEDWKKLHPSGLRVGARESIQVKGGSISMIQADPNIMPFEAMKHKELQMVALGARIIQEKTEKTATASNINRTTETSTLANIANNVSAAYMQALMWAWIFTDPKAGDENKVEYTLNNDFKAFSEDPQYLAQVVASWMAGAITGEEMREVYTKAGIATEDIGTWKDATEDTPAGLPGTTLIEQQGGDDDGS